MVNHTILSASLVAIALSLATGCSSTAQQDQNTSQAPSATIQPVQTAESPSPTPSAQPTLSSADRQFVTEAAQGGLAEVQLGQLASQRGASNAVKQFGQRMVQDHSQANNQLQQLATQKGMTLPTGIGNENEKVRQQLSKLSGTSFDRQYMNHMVQDHVKDVSLYQRQAQQGQNPDLKAFAAQTLPILQQHLQQARSIANPTTSTSTPSPSSTR
ncbi:DUF4142 domain-containing protein [Nostoc sp. 106C]|uniref:DUF4142 domain-containing protein n=1 Tax=Nostoc sp. 106C TaxID=1932667 RepID=UPI000A399D23|nr:DUF4142 domain-containing protein [Nostoc sp. 106C]OUL18648.1 DUF305 domain-containing protein [Nostoc sp. RF31YmG]OUL19298.1 DUF305 domain-containing protein [Nostoc sp. 106C]